MKKMDLANILQNSYSLTIMTGVLISSVDWVERKTLLLEEGELKEDCLTVTSHTKMALNDSLEFGVKNVVDIYEKIFDNGKLVEEYIYDREGLDFILKTRDDIVNGLVKVSEMYFDDKMKIYNKSIEMFQFFKVKGIADNNPGVEFIDNYDFKTLDDHLFSLRVMIETISSVSFNKLKDFIIKDFGSDILDISATCIDIPVSSLMDKIKYYMENVETLITPDDIDTSRAIVLINEQVQHQIMAIPRHVFSGIMNAVDEVTLADFVNSFDIPGDISEDSKENYMKYMNDMFDKNKWNTRAIILPLIMSKDGATKGLVSLTVTYGYYNGYTDKSYAYAVNMLSSSVDDEIDRPIFAAYFVSNFLPHVLTKDKDKILEAAKQVKNSAIYDLSKKNIRSKEITLDFLLEREDLPDELREAVEEIIAINKEKGHANMPPDLLEKLGDFVRNVIIPEEEAIEEDEEILYN